MTRIRLDDLWSDTAPQSLVDRASLPEAVRRYFDHAISPSASIAAAVWLKMRGTMKLKTWCPFTAEQVIRPSRGMIWEAKTKMGGLPVSGFDRLVDGKGAMCWKILGLIPVMRAEDDNVTRSAAARMFGELTWLPSALLANPVNWTETDPSHIRAESVVAGQDVDLDLEIRPDGGVINASFSRWGNPRGTFEAGRFGVVVEEEQTFAGFTMPSKVRAGWLFGSDVFESEGVFFRATIESAEFR